MGQSLSPIFRQPITDRKFCPRCTTVKPVSEFYRNVARSDGIAPLCSKCHGVETSNRRAILRAEAMTVLGSKCAECDWTDPRALQFDHINGGGHARQRAGENNHGIVKAILAGSTEFQLLCANHNWIKKFEQNETVGERQYDRIVLTSRTLTNRFNSSLDVTSSPAFTETHS